MSICSSLKSFSLPELFRLIEQQKKSGRLIVQGSLTARQIHLSPTYYIWFQDGYLVAISDRLNYKGLIEFIENRGWLSPLVTNKLRTLCPPELPLGVYLHKSKLLSKEKLNLVFQLQLHQVYELFQLNAGSFRFDELAELRDRLLTIPWLEMTGHRMLATQVSMYALRLVKNCEIFTDQLPEPSFGLLRLVDQPHLKLMALEWELWQLADGQISLKKMAEITVQPLFNVRFIAFRLIVVGLVDEIFLSSYQENPDAKICSQNGSHGHGKRTKKKQPKIRESLIDNVLHFWRKQ